ncbi:MAG: 7-carboxy-7-deazaguanine synthase QueE [Magnetococcus sp. DMHC-6]
MPHTQDRFPICHIFASIQGEGYWVGRPMAFVRVWGCPLSCAWCDEPLHRDPQAVQYLTAQEILTHVQRVAPGIPNLLLTGGEPLAVAGLQHLVACFKQAGYWLAMESSGIGGEVPQGLDWLTLSPKPHHPPPASILAQAQEIKFIVDAHPSPTFQAIINQQAQHHPHVWVQPKARGSEIDPHAVARCVEMVLAGAGKLRLSLQVHKWIKIA